MKKLRNWGKSRVLFSIAIFFTLTLLAACQKQVSIRSSISIGEDVVKSISVGRAELTSARIEGRIEYSKGGKLFRFHASILVKEPDRLYVQTSGFGFPAALLSVHGEKVKAYVPSRNRLFEGSSKKGLSSLVMTSVPSEEWMQLLLGHVPAFSEVRDVIQNDDEWTVVAKRKKQVVKLLVDQHSGWLNSYEIPSQLTKVIFGPPLATPIGGYPSSIDVKTSSGNVSIDIEKIEPNANPPDDHFRIDAPKSLTAEPLPFNSTLLE